MELAPEVFVSLTSMVAVRRGAIPASGERLRQVSERALQTMFLLMFVFAACLHLFSHWQPESHTVNNDKAVEAVLTFSRFQLCAGMIGLLCGATSLGVFLWHNVNRFEERDQDYRALAEGLRVQFVWCIAGLHRSAAAHYMERQRNEMYWIRNAINSLSMPYHRWSTSFNEANQELQLRLLNWARTRWVKKQADYHRLRVRQLIHRLHSLHKAGGVLALSGVLQTVLLIWDHWRPFLETASEREYPGQIVAIATIAGLCICVNFVLIWRAKTFEADDGEQAGRATVINTLADTCWTTVNRLVPTEHEDIGNPLDRRSGPMLIRFFIYIVAAAALGGITAAACVVGAKQLPEALPSSDDLIKIVGGTFLIGGALAVAWAEKNLLSEQAYQFNTMATLHAAALQRLDDYLRQAEEARSQQNNAEYAFFVKEIQRLLYNLGVEALDENAEWLILHRARPIEPMMAG